MARVLHAVLTCTLAGQCACARLNAFLHPSLYLQPSMTPLRSARAALAMSAMLLSLAGAQNCTAPPPSSSFDYSTMDGAWYEIARIQTAGGNALQVGGLGGWVGGVVPITLGKACLCALFEPG